MEPKGSLPHSQSPATHHYLQPDQSMPPDPTSRIYILILSHLYLGHTSGDFVSGLPTKTLYAPHLSFIRVTCPTDLILLDLHTRNTAVMPH
jgi:hypothetical protein